MKWIIKYCSICTFLCVLFLTKSSKAELQQGFQLADSIYASGNFLDAAIEYERLIFYSASPDVIRKARIKKAFCYKQLYQFGKAADCLSKIKLFALPDSTIWKVKTEMALCYYLNNEAQKAIVQIQMAKHLVKNDSLKKKTLILEPFCYNEITDWKNALASGLSYIDSEIANPIEKEQKKMQFKQFYSKKQLPKLKSPEKAENLSRFVPGLGQVYCGKVVEGSFNFLLNASFLAIGIHQIWNKFYFTGYTAGFGIFHKTYFGNMARAKHLAKSVSKERHQDFNSKTIDFLIHLNSKHINN